MSEKTRNDHEGSLIVHGAIGVVCSAIIGSFCGLFGRPIKRCFLKGALIPGMASVVVAGVNAKHCDLGEVPMMSLKSFSGFSVGYSATFLVAYSLFLGLRKFTAVFIRSLDQ